MAEKYFNLSARHTPASIAKHIGLLDNNKIISTTWIINNLITDEELNNLITEITEYCLVHNLNVIGIDKYHLQISGTSDTLGKALQTEFHQYEEDNLKYHVTTSDVSLPISWTNKINNILGLSTNKIAHPRHIKGEKIKETDDTQIKTRDIELSPRASVYFYPTQLATLYNFPTGLNGSGQKVGIIELGGGYLMADIISYLQSLNINTIPSITNVSVDGAINNPSDTSGANIEVVLDIEIIVALAPNANIFVYFAPNSEQGFYNAINKAIIDGCNIISISWGAPEPLWSSLTKTSFNNLFQTATLQNINVFVAAGDAGSGDGLSGNNVDFPASSQYVIACGGTNLKTQNNTTISSEVVWNNNSTTSATGGGISTFFAKPSYQNNVTYNLNNKRGVPDVSGNADPNSGYIIYSSNDGGSYVVGGTSAVSPLWSGLMALINQSIGTPVNFINSVLYNNPNSLRDITSGNNGSYIAGVGWDPCTGNGTPDGLAILNLFSAPLSPIANFTGTPLSGVNPLIVQFTDSSTNSPTSWSWNFGDSSTSILQNPIYTYTTNGTFNVSLTATNNNGSNILTRNNYVTVQSVIIPPVASFNATPVTGTIPLNVNFTDTSTNNPTQWSWNFGDNTIGIGQNPSHLYNAVGTYTVTLTAFNSAGSNTVIRQSYITVQALPISPVTAFTGTPLSGLVPLTVNFTDNSTNNPTSWLWNFGDSTTSTIKSPSHVFSSVGTFNITLTASNSNGSNTLVKNSYITTLSGSTPQANFSATPTTGNILMTSNFTDLSINNPTSWLWNFGDGTTSTSKNPSKSFSVPGTYNVKLTATNSYGSNTIIKNNYIVLSYNLAPIAQFISNVKSGKAPLTIFFNDKSSGYPNRWLWNFGDGFTSQLQNPSHRYSTKGTFTVTLKVWNNIGNNTIIKAGYVKTT